MELNLLHPPERRFWMCRASRGWHYPHFKQHNVIAMGHFDGLQSLQIYDDPDQMKERLSKFLKKNPEIEERTANNHVNQALTFIYEANIDDVVITVNSRRILIGVIKSDAYFEKNNLIIKSDDPKYEDDEMSSFLRREVEWVTSVDRDLLPYSLSRGIMGNQTFFNLDDYEDEIYSLIAAFVYKDGKLSANFRIEQKQDISAYQYSIFTNTIFKCEFLAKNMDVLPTIKSEKELQKKFEDFCNDGGIESNLKAEFASPGWTALDISMVLISSGFFLVLVNIALGGGKTSLEVTKEKGFKADAETPGLLNSKLVQYIGKRLTDTSITAIDRFLKKDKPEELKNTLGLKKPPKQPNLELLQGGLTEAEISENVFEDDFEE